jgi:sugar O-acyltransferase (sialic acid O-acetyltransferase NeuD family)
MTQKILILGAVGNCIDILDTINAINVLLPEPRYQCIGFLDDDDKKWGTVIHDVPVLGGLDSVSQYKDAFLINGIASPSSFWIRKEIADRIAVSTERFETIVHPTASVSPLAKLGRGVIIFQNATITTNVTVGDHTYILPNSVLSHDSIIGNYTCVAGGVIVCGNVTIGETCYLGANSTIKQGVTIGDQCLIGMGSVVVDDVQNNSVVAGNPAHFLRTAR